MLVCFQFTMRLYVLYWGTYSFCKSMSPSSSSLNEQRNRFSSMHILQLSIRHHAGKRIAPSGTVPESTRSFPNSVGELGVECAIGVKHATAISSRYKVLHPVNSLNLIIIFSDSEQIDATSLLNQ